MPCSELYSRFSDYAMPKFQVNLIADYHYNLSVRNGYSAPRDFIDYPDPVWYARGMPSTGRC